MFVVYYQGKVICGVFIVEVVEIKVVMVNKYVRENEYLLLCMLEKV